MLFHKEVYWPFPKFQIGRVKLQYSAHALYAAQDESIDTPLFVTVYDENLFEAEQLSGKITKFGLRIVYDETHDLVLIICPPVNPKVNQSWRVKTVWLQHKDDGHRTLDTSRYCKEVK